MKRISIVLITTMLLGFFSASAIAQNDTLANDCDPYGFSLFNEVPVTPVKDQHRSGTCWAFAATSFVEAEILRMTDDSYDLSEMFFVRNAYEDKALNYVRRHGKSNFSAGGQAHDVFNTIDKYGMVAENDYPGLTRGEEKHNHSELDGVLKAFVDAVVKNRGRRLSDVWFEAYCSILDVYMGGTNNLNPEKLLKKTNFNTNDYIELTSYNCYPWFEEVNLQIPDNWSYDTYINIPLDDLMAVINYAFENGYSVCWDGDVSSRGFSHSNGVAIVPEENVDNLVGTELSRWMDVPEDERADKLYAFSGPVPEKKITDDDRMDVFADYTSTDDHLMHLTAMVKDKQGNIYYRTKNSWDTDSNDMGGYLNMSEAYVRLNTVAIMVHKDAVPVSLRGKIIK